MQHLAQYEDTAALRRIFFTLVDVTDGYTPETGLTFTGAEVQVSENGAAWATGAGTVSADLGDGTYYYAATQAELDTVGVFVVKIEKAGCRIATIYAQVTPRGPYLGIAGAVVSDANNSTTSFEVDLSSSVNNFYKSAFIVFTSGALEHQVRRISSYNGTTKFITLSDPFTVTPTTADKFVILNV